MKLIFTLVVFAMGFLATQQFMMGAKGKGVMLNPLLKHLPLNSPTPIKLNNDVKGLSLVSTKNGNYANRNSFTQVKVNNGPQMLEIKLKEAKQGKLGENNFVFDNILSDYQQFIEDKQWQKVRFGQNVLNTYRVISKKIM